MAHIGTDLLSASASRSHPAPSARRGRDDGLLALLGSASLVWLGVLTYLLVTMGTALP